jgi:hypothetical protein
VAVRKFGLFVAATLVMEIASVAQQINADR